MRNFSATITVLLVVCNMALPLTSAFATPQLRMQFTLDTADAAPATATPVQGGFSSKPTSLINGANATVLVRLDPVATGVLPVEMFEKGNVVELNDSSTTAAAGVVFDGNDADKASGTNKARIDLDMMLISNASNSGDINITVRNSGTSAVSSLSVSLTTGKVLLNNYSTPDTVASTTEIGYAAFDKSFHLQLTLDFGSANGDATVIASGLSYSLNDDAGYSIAKTGTFAKSSDFDRLDVSTTASGKGKIFVDNIGITNINTNLVDKVAANYNLLGDGTDETSKLQSALSDLGSVSKKLTLEANKTYMISYGLNCNYKSDFTIDGNGATIKYINATPVTGGNWGIIFYEGENFTVKNLTIDGNRANRTPAEVYADNFMLNECRMFRFENVKAINATTDGFCVEAQDKTNHETYSRNGLILNCVADNGYRQGMSIINGHHIYVIGGEYKNTNGTIPESGIDVEPDAPSAPCGAMDINIRNVKFSDNDGFGVILSSRGTPRNHVIENCYFTNNACGGINLCSAYTTVRNNFFEKFSGSTRGIIDFGSTTGSTNDYNRVTYNWFNNIQTGLPTIYVHATAGGNNYIGYNISRNYNFNDTYGDNDGIRNRNGSTLESNTTALNVTGYWTLDGNVNDSSGNNINGSIVGSPSFPVGQYGYALDLSGSGQYALIADSALLDVTDRFTLCAWIYADSGSTASQIVIGKNTDFRFGYSGNTNFGLYAPSAIGKWVFTTVAKNAWHHVAATYNGRMVTLYVDGTEIKTADVKPGSIGTANQVHIGSYSGTTYCFDGKIDDVRIYNAVLSGTAINAVIDSQDNQLSFYL